MYFSWATDLDPKGVNSQIKEAILSPGQSDEESPSPQSGNYHLRNFLKISQQNETLIFYSKQIVSVIFFIQFILPFLIAKKTMLYQVSHFVDLFLNYSNE